MLGIAPLSTLPLSTLPTVAAGGAYVATLSAPVFQFTGQPLSSAFDYMIVLSTPVFAFLGKTLNTAADFMIILSTPVFLFTTYAASVVQGASTALTHVFNPMAASVGRLMNWR